MCRGYTHAMPHAGHSDQKYCRKCGAAVEFRTPQGDTRVRAVCPQCHEIHYVNPLLVVGTLPYWHDGRVLLCKRNIEPRRGFWTLPAGFMEMNETTAEGALRETMEEAGAQIRMGAPLSLINLQRAGQVHLFYLAELVNTTFAPGEESMEARLFAEADIPWSEMAFRSVEITLRYYFQHRHNLVAPGLLCADV